MAERLSEDRLKRIASYGDQLDDVDAEPASPAEDSAADATAPDTSAHIYDAVKGSAILASRWRKRRADAGPRH